MALMTTSLHLPTIYTKQILIASHYCPYMNTVACEGLEQEGSIFLVGLVVFVLNYYEAARIFFKSKNATKALHHVLKTPSQGICPCKGSIPFQKKVQFKSLLTACVIKKRLQME